MGNYEVQEYVDLTIPKDTIIRARLEEIKEKEISWTDKVTGEAKSKVLLEWWWQVTGGEYHSRKVKGTCDALLSQHPRNKFRLWAEALLQRPLPVGAGVDPDELTGMSADITVWHRPDKNDPSKTYEEIDEVMSAAEGGSGSSWNDDPPF